jgi:Type II secretory pathway, component PulD
MTRTFILPIRPVGVSLALTALALSDSAAGTYQSGTGGLEGTAQRELVRRQEDLAAAQQRLKAGDRALAEKDYETAYLAYLDAVDLIGSGPAVQSERSKALSKFSSTGVTYAEELIASGRYSEAEQVAKTILLQQYNPTYQPAIRLLSHLEQPDYYNKSVTPRLAAKREDVSRLLAEAEGFYSRGSFDSALKRYEEVLSLDRYNIAANKGIEKVNLARSSYYQEAYNETRSRMLWKVTEGWRLPNRRYFGGKDTIETTVSDSTSQNEQIIAKLNQIIIPSIDFQDMSVRDAVDLLRQLSQKLDTVETDPAKKGVNIFLSLGSGGSSAGTGGGDLLPAVPGEEAAPQAPVVTEDTPITLSLTNVPLYEALRYVADLAGLKIKIDPVAVSIVPLTDVSNELITKEYRVPPNFIPSSSGTSLETSTFSFDDTSTESRMGARMTAREYLESLGVDFPEGASAQYISSGSRLLVRNTQDNIDFIDTIVDAARGAVPTQVQIEAKFVEVNQNNLKELGFDWLLGPMSIGNGVYASGGEPALGSEGFPFVQPGKNQPIGTDYVTRGIRSGTGTGPNAGVSVNSLDGLLSRMTSGAAPGIFSLAGIYTNPQFQVVIRALDQRKGIDLLSAPKVTARSGERAVVNIIREFRYPTEFDPPQIPQSIGTGNNFGAGVTTGFTTSPIITPTTPAAFETRNLGVTLEVTPVVGPDGYTIDLDLSPEVIDFDGFVNYGTPIRSIASTGGLGGIGAQPVSVIVSDNVINQPVFSTRKVTTNITIWDGMTVALGGLIREDVQKVQDKVPFLGDVPLVGRLFRTDIDQKLKKNLIVFVTATLIDAEGKPLRSDLEQEEIVEPLGLPEEIAPPVYQVKGSTYK